MEKKRWIPLKKVFLIRIDIWTCWTCFFGNDCWNFYLVFFWWNLSLSSTPSASCFQPVSPNSIGTLVVVPNHHFTQKTNFGNGTYIYLHNKRKHRWFLPVLTICHQFHHSSKVWCFSKRLFPCRGRQYWPWHRSMCLKSQFGKTLGLFRHFLGFPRWNQITKAFGQSWQIWTIGCWTINFNDQPAISHSKMSLSYE